MEYESSSIDWCEDNYVYSNYIAEFYNSISNIPYILFYFLGLYSFKKMKCKRKDRLLYGGLLFTGISSFYFHATLSLYGQLLDEFSIILLLTNVLLVTYKRGWVRLLIQTYVIIHCILMIYFPFINIPVLFSVGFLIWREYRNKNIMAQKHIWKNTEFYFFIAMICWFLDKFFCDYVKFLNLHAFWHIFSAIGSYYGLMIVIYLKYENNIYMIDDKNYLPYVKNKYIDV
jgi:hypothetical protein